MPPPIPCPTPTSLALGWACKNGIIGDSKVMGKEKEGGAEVGLLWRSGGGIRLAAFSQVSI